MSANGRLRFAEFELDPANHVLTRNRVVIRLAPQPFKILTVLMDRRGTLVTRAVLREAVWGSETVVDFEHGLNSSIRQIRLALSDDADTPRFIETVPRLGYRFTAAVVEVPATPERRFPRALVVAGAAAGLAITSVLLSRAALHGPAPERTPVASETRDLYLRGRLALDDPSTGSARTALALFEQALTRDPGYALARAGVAQVYLQKPSSIPGVPPDVAMTRARDAVDKALALGDSLPETHLAAAELRMTLHDWAEAGREYRRALEIAPHDTLAHQQYAMWLSYQARFDEALDEARVGEALDPLSVRARNTVAEVLRHARRFDEAIVQAKRALELNPNFGRAHTVLGHCYFAQGHLNTAIEEHLRGSTGPSGNLGAVYGFAGRTSEAREVLGDLEKRYAANRGGPGEIAQVYIGLHDFDRAFEWLARAVEDGGVWTLKVAAVWDPLRLDPRFDQLLRESGYGT